MKFKEETIDAKEASAINKSGPISWKSLQRVQFYTIMNHQLVLH